MTEMTSIERVNKHMNLEEPDRVGIAPLGGFYRAPLANMSIEEFLMDPDKADEAFEYGFKKHGGIDMAETGFLLAQYLGPMPGGFSTFYLDWHLPGRERDPYDIPNLNERAKEEPLMTEDDYDLILKHGFHRFFSFKRAGVGDLALLASHGPRVGQLARKWWEQYKVPTMIDSMMDQPIGTIARLRGTTNFLLDLRRHPDKMLEVLDIASEAGICYSLALAERVHATTLILGSSSLSADFVSPKIFEKFALPFILRSAWAAVEAGYRLQYHFDTNWTPLLPYMKDLPPKSGFYHMDERTDIFEAKKILGDHLCLLGNLKPSLFTFGTEDEVEYQVKEIIDRCGGGGGLIVSSELPADAKFELVDKMIQTVKTYGAY